MPFSQHIPKPFRQNDVRAFAPVTSGVYGISSSREWIYIGEAADIQGALLSHFEDGRNSLMQHAPSGFVFEVCDGGTRQGRQDRLVSEYNPACNRQTQRLS